MMRKTGPGRWMTGVLLGIALAAPARADRLLPLPRPELGQVEPAVRKQLVEQRAALADLIAAGATVDADLGRAYGALGQAYFAYDLLEAAEPCLLNAHALDPDGFSWPYLLGVVYTRSGAVDAAFASLSAAARLRPDDVPTHLRLGRLYLDLARFEEAEARFTRVLASDHRSAAAHHGLGRIAQERGDWSASLEHLEKALELQPGATSIHYLLGIAHRELGDLSAARRHLARNRHDPVLFSDPQVDGLDALIEGGRYYVQLGDLARGRGNDALAIRAFREAVQRGPTDPLAHYNLGVLLAANGAPAEGLEHLRRAVRLDPDYRDAHFNLGLVLGDAGRMAEAEEHFSRAHAIDPGDDEIRRTWARSLTRLGRMAEAEEVLVEMLDRDPEDDETALALAETLEAASRPVEARDRLRALIERSPHTAAAASAHAHLSRLALAANARPAAIEHLRAAVRIDPRLPGAFERLGALFGQESLFGESATAYGRAVAAEPASLTARFGQAMALLFSGREVEALRTLEEGIARVDDDLPLRHLLARVLATAAESRARDGARALALANDLFRARETADHAETVAMALAEVGDFRRAVEWQERALGLAAEEPQRRRAGIERRLALYRRGEPCRTPWLDG